METWSIIFLVFMTTGNLLQAAPVDDFCGKTREPPRCKGLLESTDIRTTTAAAVVLEEIAIAAANHSASIGSEAVQTVLGTEKDPIAMRIFTNCDVFYLNALVEVAFGRQNLERRRYAKLVRTGEIVFHVVGGCEGAIQHNPSLKRSVDDTGVLGQLIGIIARAL